MMELLVTAQLFIDMQQEGIIYNNIEVDPYIGKVVNIDGVETPVRPYQTLCFEPNETTRLQERDA